MDTKDTKDAVGTVSTTGSKRGSKRGSRRGSNPFFFGGTIIFVFFIIFILFFIDP